MAPEVDKYRPNVRTLPLSLAPPKLKRLLNVPGLEPEPPKPYPDAGNALGTGNLSERTECEMEVGLTKAQMKRRRKKAMACPKDKATTEAKVEYGTSERPPVSEDSRESKEKMVTKEEVPISPEEHSSVSSLSECGKNQITDDNFSQEARSLSEPLSAEIPAETDIVTEHSEFIETAHQFADALQAVSGTGGMDLTKDEVVGLAKVVAKCVIDRMSPERAAIEFAKTEGMVNSRYSEMALSQRDASKSSPGSASDEAKALSYSSESSVEPRHSSSGCQDHSESKLPSQGTNAKVDTPISLGDKVDRKDEMDSLIKTENCDMPDSTQLKNCSDEVGTIKNDPSTIPYPALAGFIRSSPSPSYQEKVDVAIGSQINVLISILVDPFCITKDPLRPFKGATVYFMREGPDWMLLRQMEGGRMRHTSIAENITDRLLELMELTAVFDDMTDPKDCDCNFRAMMFRHLPPSFMQKRVPVQEVTSLAKVDISLEDYRELISKSKKFGRRMTYEHGEPVNALTIMCVPMELNLGEKLVRNLFRLSDEGTPVERISVSGGVCGVGVV